MTVKGSCHCGETQFEVDEAPVSVTRCTCSFCSKRGVLWGYYKPAQFRLTTPPERAATYRWRTKTNQHHFCANCGCGTLFPIARLVHRQGGFRPSEDRHQCATPG